MDPEEEARRARARAHARPGRGAEHATATTGGHHHTTTAGRSTAVHTTAPVTPRATRSASGDFAGEDVTATLDGGGGTIRGTMAVRIPSAAGARSVRRFTVRGELAWDNTGSTGFRGQATAEDGTTSRVSLVLSGRGHLHVELFRTEASPADAAAAVSDRFSFEADRGAGRTVLTDAGDATLTAGVAAGHLYPDLDVILEQIAHRFAYDVLDGTVRTTLQRWGWRVVPHGRTEGELQMLALCPIPGHPEPRDPVLAFRGTEPTSIPDWADDFNAEGIGMYEFTRNEAEIHATLMRLGSGVIVTGHSLGGALAQICAATYPGPVGEIVTFQAPGISSDLAARVAAARIASRHHVVDGCVVGLAGEAHTPGTTYHHHADGAIDPYHAHTVLPLSEETEAVLPDGAGFGERSRWDFVSTTETTEDPSMGFAEVGRIALPEILGVDDRLRAPYVRAWRELRQRASEGHTPYRELLAMIEEAPSATREGLRDNLDHLFPELPLAGELETAIYDGTVTTEAQFVESIEASLGELSGDQRTRLRHYWSEARGLSPVS